MENIRKQLKQLKQYGKSACKRVKRIIQNVELHIGVPKGYDIRVLNEVKQAAGTDVMVEISEIQ